MIEVNNLTKLKIDKGFLKKVAENVLASEKSDKGLSIAIVGPEEIQRLNKKYRKKDKPTDVLSFDYGESGEVVLCPQQINGKIDYVLVHGILHILGYNHRQMKNLKING
ncbi:MAG: rRNA maturation RNase YbeY [Candidatus Nealsonbacteria bacterium]